jgi:uncharacterized protein YqeY
MSIFEKIQSDMYKAMKDKDADASKTLRVVLAKLKDKKIEKREDLTKAEEIKVLQSLSKQRKESIKMFKGGGREDLVSAEEKELSIIEQYLPKMLSEDDIKTIVKDAIDESGAVAISDIGKVMPLVMKKGAGRIDGKKAQIFLRELLQ